MLTVKEKLDIKNAAFREIANVLDDALECDGFKHRHLPEVSEGNEDEADDHFFKAVAEIISDLRKRVVP